MSGVCEDILPEGDAAATDCCSQVESVSWCLAADHINDGLLCVDRRSSVTVCYMSSSAAAFTLIQLYNIGVDTVPQGQCCICHALHSVMLCTCSHAFCACRLYSKHVNL